MSAFALHYTEWFVGVGIVICIIDEAWHLGAKYGYRKAMREEASRQRADRVNEVPTLTDVEEMFNRPYLFDQDANNQ